MGSEMGTLALDQNENDALMKRSKENQK